MLIGSAVLAVIVLFFVFFIFYKRTMLIKLFSLDAANSSEALQEQLNQTADAVIKRLEAEIARLEFLLDEAENKSSVLERQLITAETIISRFDSEEFSRQQSHIDIKQEAIVPELTEAVYEEPEEKKAAANSIDQAVMDKRNLVSAMLEQGYTITEIAKATSMGKGEILLLINLHKK